MNAPNWAVVPTQDQLPGCVFLLSPHHSRDQHLPKEKVRYIVLHGTGSGSAAFGLYRMLDPDNKAEPSAHFLVTEVGEILCLVPLNLVAWHAGRSGWKRLDELNPMSIGIEIQNNGKDPYTTRQIEAVTRLLRFLLEYFNLPPSAVLGHRDVSPYRKQDPYPYFFWQALEQCGLAQPWTPLPDVTPMEALAAWGYCYGPGPGHSVRKLKESEHERDEFTDECVILAFQARFQLPMTGKLDHDTCRFIATGLR